MIRCWTAPRSKESSAGSGNGCSGGDLSAGRDPADEMGVHRLRRRAPGRVGGGDGVARHQGRRGHRGTAVHGTSPSDSDRMIRSRSDGVRSRSPAARRRPGRPCVHRGGRPHHHAGRAELGRIGRGRRGWRGSGVMRSESDGEPELAAPFSRGRLLDVRVHRTADGSVEGADLDGDPVDTPDQVAVSHTEIE